MLVAASWAWWFPQLRRMCEDNKHRRQMSKLAQIRVYEHMRQEILAAPRGAERRRRLKALDDEIGALELRWLEIGEALEQLA